MDFLPGMSPVNEKVEAIWNAPTPSNVSQLKSFPGHDQLLPKISAQFVICAPTTTLSSLQENSALREVKSLSSSDYLLAIVHLDQFNHHNFDILKVWT